jgi:S1-C subfamily serine protease
MSRLTRVAVAVAAFGLLMAGPVSAQRPEPVVDAVVFIRVFATARAEYMEVWKKVVERRGIEVATGSGFIVTPSGHLVTNHHVVSGDQVKVRVDGRDVTIQATIERIDVVLASGQQFGATVLASDPEMDLAILSIGGSDLPYMPLGDSDAVEPGAEAIALGFPFGQAVEIGRLGPDETLPRQATITSGTVSAIRNGNDDEPRYLQVTNSLNPGNSGGPVVDREGYALGVVSMQIAKAEGIGFAIAINRVKDFLERSGLDGELPARRLRLGPPTSMEFKGLRVRMPHGYIESGERLPFGAQQRLRVVALDSSRRHAELFIDRLASPWRPQQMEQAFLSGQIVEGRTFDIDPRRRRVDSRGWVFGHAATTNENGERLAMVYGIGSVGVERVIARYVGLPDDVAFNLAVFRESLRTLEIEPLLRGEEVPPPAWPEKPLSASSWGENWLPITAAPLVCSPEREKKASNGPSAGSPVQDFTQTLRFRAWFEYPTLEHLRGVCREARASEYRVTRQFAGVSYRIDGFFIVVRDEPSTLYLVQIEAVAPSDRGGKLYEWLLEWKGRLEKQ